MGFVIGLIIGLVVGGAIAYFMGAQKAAARSAVIQDLKRQLDLADSEHERRLREATTQLQRDYDAQLQTAKAQAAKASQAAKTTQSTPPHALVSPPPAAEKPAAPTPQPPAAPPEPEVVAPPVTATAPAPIPQPVKPSPKVPEKKAEKSVPGQETVIDVADPNALLAASYAPESSVRSAVAAAIARILPTAGPQGQARWFPVVSRLARDANPEVRLEAVKALAAVKSPKRLPLLNRALKDADPAVVQAANQIVSQSKGRSRSTPKPAKRRLPKNR